MFRKHFISTFVAAAAILAFSASAAQARPIGLGYTDHSQSVTASRFHFISPSRLHSSQGPARPGYVAAQVMSPAVDPANAQQVPVVVTVAASDSGFNWTAAVLGAGYASAVVVLAAAAARRIRSRWVAQV